MSRTNPSPRNSVYAIWCWQATKNDAEGVVHAKEDAAAAVIQALEPSLRKMESKLNSVKLYKQVLGVSWLSRFSSRSRPHRWFPTQEVAPAVYSRLGNKTRAVCLAEDGCVISCMHFSTSVTPKAASTCDPEARMHTWRHSKSTLLLPSFHFVGIPALVVAP